MYGKNLLPLGKTLVLSDGINQPLVATYYPSKDTFIIEFGQLIIGKTYMISANWTTIPNKFQQISIPSLLKVIQIDKRQIKLLFNTNVDSCSALNNYNYWISCNRPGITSIATLGQNDSRYFNNSLKPYNSFIICSSCSSNEYLIQFTKDIESGIEYKVMPYGISIKYLSDYIGPNFNSSNDIAFIGM